MEFPSKLLEQIAFNTSTKIGEHMLIVMVISVRTEYLSQPLQTNNKQFKLVVTFLNGYNGIFNVTDKNNKFCFSTFFSEIQQSFINIPPGVYELESLDAEIKRICITDGNFREDDFPFKIKLNFSTLGSIIEIDVGIGRQISFMYDDSRGNFLGFETFVLHEEYNLSDYPVDILSFDNNFLECDIAQGMIFKGKRNGIIHNFTMEVDPGYKYFDKFIGGVQGYIMESKDIVFGTNYYHSMVKVSLFVYQSKKIKF